MLLNDKQIKATIASEGIKITPFDESSIEPATYDLHVGHEGITTRDKERRDIKDRGYLTIEPGDFALVITQEVIKLDLFHVGRFGLRSKFARSGLIATVGLQVDPGFHGCLKLGLVNMSTNPITLSYAEHFLSIEFHRLQEAANGYAGEYQNQFGLGAKDYELIAQQGRNTFSEAFESLRILSTDVSDLTKTVDGLTRTVSQHAAVVANDMENLNKRFDGELGLLSKLLTNQSESLTRHVTDQVAGLKTEISGVNSRISDKKTAWFAWGGYLLAVLGLVVAVVAWLRPLAAS